MDKAEQETGGYVPESDGITRVQKLANDIVTYSPKPLFLDDLKKALQQRYDLASSWSKMSVSSRRRQRSDIPGKKKELPQHTLCPGERHCRHTTGTGMKKGEHMERKIVSARF